MSPESKITVMLVDPFGLREQGTWQVDIGGVFGGAEIASTIYHSERGWFPNTSPDINAQTTLVGGGITIIWDAEPNAQGYEHDTVLTVGTGKYLGYSESIDKTKSGIGLRLSLGTPLGVSTPIKNTVEWLVK